MSVKTEVKASRVAASLAGSKLLGTPNMMAFPSKKNTSVPGIWRSLTTEQMARGNGVGGGM